MTARVAQNSAEPAQTHTVTHRWPWRREEFVSMFVAASLVSAFGYWISTARPFYAVPILAVTALAALGSVFMLYRTKTHRVTTSQVTVTITNTLVSTESKGTLGKSQADVARAKTISCRRFGSDETFVIADDSRAVRIPLRVTHDPQVLGALQTAFATAGVIDRDATDLYARVGTI